MPGLPYALPYGLPGGLLDATDADNALSLTGGAAGTLAELTSHGDGAIALLIAEYQDSPRLQALVRTYADRVQEFESGAVGVYSRALDLDTAAEDQLDLIGRIVREGRNGRADLAYRRALRVRILINRSQGRHEDLIAIVRLFEGTTTGTIRIQDVHSARIEVRIDDTPVNALSEIHARLGQAKPAAVALQTIGYPAGTLATAFRLVTVAEAQSKSNYGLADIGRDIGGCLAHVLA